MSLSDSFKKYAVKRANVADVAKQCAEHFEKKGYNVRLEDSLDGAFVSITKGGLFKSIAGMSTGLNITLVDNPQEIVVKMEVGIFGKQIIPSAISMLVFWPVLIPQVYGLIKQSNLDKEAYRTIEEAINYYEKSGPSRQVGMANSTGGRPSGTGIRTAGGVQRAMVFCPYCGERNPAINKTCRGCGRIIDD